MISIISLYTQAQKISKAPRLARFFSFGEDYHTLADFIIKIIKRQVIIIQHVFRIHCRGQAVGQIAINISEVPAITKQASPSMFV